MTTAHSDTPGPSAHTPRPPSESPSPQSPSPDFAPHRSLPALPAPLPAPADNAPADSLAGSAPCTSVVPLHTPTPPRPASSPPAPQITRAHTSLPDTPLSSRSTPTGLAAALAPVSSLLQKCAAQDRPPSLPATAANVPSFSLSFSRQTALCCKYMLPSLSCRARADSVVARIGCFQPLHSLDSRAAQRTTDIML